MIEIPPSLHNIEEKAINLLTDPLCQDILARIDHDYLYWDKVKYLAPQSMQPELLWAAVKLKRAANRVHLTFGKYTFQFTITSQMQALLHEFDLNFGSSAGVAPELQTKDRQQYLLSAIMEEAIASSQMEGASTTRKEAKEMLRKQLKPVNKSQQLIVNNYATINFLLEHDEQRLTLDFLQNIQHSIATQTLQDATDEGRFRRDNSIYVMNDLTGEVAHTPPDVDELPELLVQLCDFANEDANSPFIHPIVKGIIIHFLLAYFHPFVDGNGRTARSLFYWYLLKKGYRLAEFLSISRVIYRSKAKYEKAFLYTEHDGLDLSYFIHYNLVAMKRAYDELKAYLARKMREKDELFTLRTRVELNHRQAQVVKILMEQPNWIVTTNEIITRFGVSPKTARADLQKLVELGLMEECPLNAKKMGYVRATKFEV